MTAGLRRDLGTLESYATLLGVSLVVLVVPGLFAIRPFYYTPFFAYGFRGFFFAYAGFESLAQAAGEVSDSTRQCPRVILSEAKDLLSCRRRRRSFAVCAAQDDTPPPAACIEKPKYSPVKAIEFHTSITSKFYGDGYAVKGS